MASRHFNILAICDFIIYVISLKEIYALLRCLLHSENCKNLQLILCLSSVGLLIITVTRRYVSRFLLDFSYVTRLVSSCYLMLRNFSILCCFTGQEFISKHRNKALNEQLAVFNVILNHFILIVGFISCRFSYISNF